VKKYGLKNLDRADCALKIEDRLRMLDAVDFITVNFATENMKIAT
jgi:hypothetical protein